MRSNAERAPIFQNFLEEDPHTPRSGSRHRRFAGHILRVPSVVVASLNQNRTRRPLFAVILDNVY